MKKITPLLKPLTVHFSLRKFILYVFDIVYVKLTCQTNQLLYISGYIGLGISSMSYIGGSVVL